MSVMGSLDALAALVLLMVLCGMSRFVRYHCKWVLFGILSCISACAFIPLMVFRPRSWKNALIPARFSQLISKILSVKFEISGLENVAPTGSVVLINHQSFLDLNVLSELWTVMDGMAVISKKEIFWLWPFGLAAWLWGTIFIDRLNPEKAQGTINKTGQQVREKKVRLVMFPEGTRHGGPTLLPFKKGAFHVAIASQTAVQPVVVSRYHFLDNATKTFNAGTVLLRVLPAISTNGMTKDDLTDLMDKTYKVMQEEYTRINEEALLRDGIEEKLVK